MTVIARRCLLCLAAFALLLAAGCGSQRDAHALEGEALFSEADIDAANLDLAQEREVVVGSESVGDAKADEDTSDQDGEALLEPGADELGLQAVLPGVDGQIAFIRHDRNCSGCQWQLFLADQITDKKTRLYSSSRELESAAVSGDGRWVVFTMQSADNNSFDVYRMNVSSKSVSRLTNAAHDATNVSMSADGNTVVWEGRGDTGRRAVVVRVYGGSGFSERILSASQHQLEPSVSGNGRFVALVRPVSGAFHMLRYDVAQNRYLTALKRKDKLMHPSVSNDGNTMAVLLRLSDRDRVIIRNVAASSNHTLMTQTSGVEHPHLTADGAYLSYGLVQSGSWRIFTLHLPTSRSARAVSTASPIHNLAPFWQQASASTSPSTPPPSEPSPPPSEPSPPPSEPSPPPSEPTPPPPGSTVLGLRVGTSSSGTSIARLGANGGGSTQPVMADIRELGLTTYRLWGGMQTLEPVDDDGVYGLPTIADMKRVLNSNSGRVDEFVNWEVFDRNFRVDAPVLRGLYGIPNMEPLMVLRNSANWGNFWVPRMNVTGGGCKTSSGQTIVWPQFTQADWNEWWQHVFAVVYWVNVRNGSSMRVDRWSVHNEPNEQPSQGWCGTKEQYVEFVKYTSDAIDFVYQTYLNDRPRHIHGGVLSLRSGWRDWLRPLLQNSSSSSFSDRTHFRTSMYNVIDMHPYRENMTSPVSKAREVIRESGNAANVRDYPIWASEMGDAINGQWNSVPAIIDKLINNLIGGSTPGDGHVEGAIVWRMYDSNNTQGLISSSGVRRPGFYALRLAIMALNGGKPVHPTQLSATTSNVMTIATREAAGRYNLLMTNRSSTPYRIDTDLSGLLGSGRADVYLFDDTRSGATSLTPITSTAISGGRLLVDLPPRSVVLVQTRP